MKRTSQLSLLSVAVWLCTAVAHAQGRGGGRTGGMPGAGFHAPNGPTASGPVVGRGPLNVPRTDGGVQRPGPLGPPGRWWDNAGVARSVGLRHEQQRRMDDIFNANKRALLTSYEALQREQARLNAVSKEAQPDRAKLFAQIDSVNQARASLEKVNTQMLLQIREALDVEQVERLGKLGEPTR